VVVSLNAPAKSGSFPCSSAFEVLTMGGGATCEVSEQTVSSMLELQRELLRLGYTLQYVSCSAAHLSPHTSCLARAASSA
jgi:hypothetical protein